MVTPARTPRPSSVVPPGFAAIVRAALVEDRHDTLEAVRQLARERSASGGSWTAFLVDLERTWRLIGRSRAPRLLIRAAAAEWPETRSRRRHGHAS